LWVIVDVRVVDRETIEPLLYLLVSNDEEVQRASSAALGNLAVNGTLTFLNITDLATNKVNIVRLGGLEPLIRLMMSPNVEVQCNAVGCITNLATHGIHRILFLTYILDENKNKIARSNALGPLTRLASAKDTRVQRNATGALLNMTHSGYPLNLNADYRRK
jgi:vacuolar protein 8